MTGEARQGSPASLRAGWARTRRFWGPELVVLALCMVVTAVLFAVLPLDLQVQRGLFSPGWPLKNQFPWGWLYRYASIPVLAVLVGAVVCLLGGLWKQGWGRYRIHCLYLLLAIALGPGLVVNTILKKNWGRPRPRHIEEFGGWETYHPALVRNAEGSGRSFPCGHSSVGFYLSTFYFLWRRRRPRRAGLALAGAVALGSATGMARMVAGGHFLSDVLWSAYLVGMVNLLLYYFVFNIPAREEGDAIQLRLFGRRWLFLAVLIAFSLATVFMILTATPIQKRMHYGMDVLRPPGAAPARVEFRSEGTDLTLRFVHKDDLRIYGQGKGFGLPGAKLKVHFEHNPEHEPPDALFLTRKRGWFSELHVELGMNVPIEGTDLLILELPQGRARLASPEVPDGVRIEVQDGELHLPSAWRGVSNVTASGEGRLVFKDAD